MRWSVLAAAGTIGISGCTGRNAVAGRQALAGAGTVAALSAVAAVAQAAEGRHPSRTASAPTIELVPSAPPPPRPFDASNALGLLRERDVSMCWPKDGPRGAATVDVTFDPTGTIVRTEIVPGPDGTPTPDAACIAHALDGVRVDDFDGDAMHVRVTLGASAGGN
jgi:hypothetical protein